MKTLTGEHLYQAFTSGGREIIRNRHELNRINVFPVPDGDTGTNLSSTITSILENSVASPSAGHTLRAMAEAGLDGARGNSGVIFAQYLQGLTQEVGEESTLSMARFASAARRAASAAYAALSKPVEGTMLTVIREWAEALSQFHDKAHDFVELLSRGFEAAQRALKDTPRKLRVLRESHVVDAGAKGFVDFVSGFLGFLRTGDAGEAIERVEEVEHEHVETAGAENMGPRYCTEIVLAGDALDLAAIRAEAEAAGESVIVAGSSRKARLHVHTDDPSGLCRRLMGHGLPVQQKVDDMLRQFEMVHRRSWPIALVTDSSCDLPQEILDRYQIHVVPLRLSIGGSQYLDRLTVLPSQFYDMLDAETEYPTTSQPDAATFRRLYSDLRERYESVIAVHLSSVLSGTYEQARREAEAMDPERIAVVDSRHLSGSLGLLVLRTAEAIAAGMPREQILRSVEEWRAKARILVSVSSLRYMVRGGRVSPLLGVVGKLMNLKPIVSLDDEGRSVLYGKAFSRRANRRRIVGMVRQMHRESPLRAYAVVHARSQEAAEVFVRELRAAVGQDPAYIMDISPVVGLNAGLGAVAVVTMQE